MSDAPEKCAVLVPVFSVIEPEVQDRLYELARRGYPVRILRGCSDISLARSVLATRAVRDGFAETMWIDSDVVFAPDDVDRLRSHDLPLAAGLYVKKGPPQFAAKFAPGTSEATFGTGGGLLVVSYVGCGFLHVRREVYETIARVLKIPTCGGGYEGETVVPYFLPTVALEPVGPVYLPEDSAFCHRARKVGFAIHADTTVRLDHLGRYGYGWKDLVPRTEFEALKLTITDEAIEKGGG